MVRIIAGTLVEVARGKRAPDDVGAILAARDRNAAGVTAPPHGLYLTQVRYAEPL
jgi:tRNA pseudouridine38-40 synthase